MVCWLKVLVSEQRTPLSWPVPAANCITEVLRALSAAYRGHGELPAPQLQRKGWAADLVQAAQAIGAPVPEALLDPKLAELVPKVYLTAILMVAKIQLAHRPCIHHATGAQRHGHRSRVHQAHVLPMLQTATTPTT